MSTISKDEISLYDRQIRLWGVDGQKRLRNARILVVGFGAVAVETVKNLVLAGAGTLTLQSTETVKEDTLGTNFFLREEDIGKNVIEASLSGVQKLNSRVIVSSETRKIEEIPDEWIIGFDGLIAIQQPLEELLRLNRLMRIHSKPFYAAGLMGWAGYIFCDLVQHQFTVEKEKSNIDTTPGEVSATEHVLDVEDLGDKERLTVRKTYSSLDDVLKSCIKPPVFASTMRPRQRNRVSPYLIALLTAWEDPGFGLPELQSKAEALGLPRTLITPEFVKEVRNGLNLEISAIAAVVGGFLAQEVINVLTLKEYPISNTLIYDGKRGVGPVYQLGC